MRNIPVFIQTFLLLGNLGMNNRGKAAIPTAVLFNEI